PDVAATQFPDSLRNSCNAESTSGSSRPAPARHVRVPTSPPLGVERPSMKRYMTCVGVLLLAGMLVSCGGGGGGGGDSPSPGTTPGGGPGKDDTQTDNDCSPSV